MTEEELTQHGWRKHPHLKGAMCWGDPTFLLAHYTFKDAVEIQERRLKAASRERDETEGDKDEG